MEGERVGIDWTVYYWTAMFNNIQFVKAFNNIFKIFNLPVQKFLQLLIIERWLLLILERGTENRLLGRRAEASATRLVRKNISVPAVP